ncbi:MAG: anthranilate phosphoribosyltransferase [Propioniciclava sp.]
MSPSWPDLLSGLVAGEDLDAGRSSWAMNQILAGEATPAQIAGFLVALQAKGATAAEIDGLVAGMLDNARPVALDSTGAVDIVGTGGDRANTVNVSTMAAVLAAAAGAPVIKHGNRAASSACGTADCLEALGVVLDLDPSDQQEVFQATGIVFLFAALYHPSLRHAAVARRELGIRTPFNVLGPLANPAQPAAAALGVADAATASLMAQVLAARGTRGLVFHGGDGLDELTTTGPSDVWVVIDGEVTPTRLDPADLGIPRSTAEALVGGDATHNAQVVRDTFAGKPGAVRDIVVLNAASALLAAEGPDPARSLAEQMTPQVARAAAAIDSGAASRLLDHWVAVTSSIAARR